MKMRFVSLMVLIAFLTFTGGCIANDTNGSESGSETTVMSDSVTIQSADTSATVDHNKSPGETEPVAAREATPEKAGETRPPHEAAASTTRTDSLADCLEEPSETEECSIDVE